MGATKSSDSVETRCRTPVAFGTPRRILHEELTALAPSATVNVAAPPARRHSAWAGGSLCGSFGTSRQMWISRGDYDVSGPAIVHRSCF